MAKVDTSKYLKRAEEAISRRNYDLAILNYTHALTLSPRDLDIRKLLRATQLRKTNEQGPAKLGASLKLAKAALLAMFGKHDRAMAACDEALSANAASLPAMERFADAAAANGMPEVAAFQRQDIADRVAPEKVANLWDLVELYEELEASQEAIKTLERIKQVDPNADVGPSLTRLEALKTSEIYIQGTREGSRSIVQNANTTQKLELESGKLRTDEQRETAIKLITETDLKNRPDDHKLYLRLAEIAMDYEDWSRAYSLTRQYLGKAQELNPADNTVRDRMGDLEIRKNNLQLKKLVDQVKANPEDTAARAAYKQLNESRIAYEVAEFERRVKAQPLKADFHNRLGRLYFDSRRYDEAIGELQAAAKDPKFRIEALTNLGRCFTEAGQLDLAIAQFQSARQGQELFQKIRDPLYFEALAQEKKGTPDSLKAALDIYAQLYQTDIGFRDVKVKMPELQKRLQE